MFIEQLCQPWFVSQFKACLENWLVSFFKELQTICVEVPCIFKAWIEEVPKPLPLHVFRPLSKWSMVFVLKKKSIVLIGCLGLGIFCCRISGTFGIFLGPYLEDLFRHFSWFFISFWRFFGGCLEDFHFFRMLFVSRRIFIVVFFFEI